MEKTYALKLLCDFALLHITADGNGYSKEYRTKVLRALDVLYRTLNVTRPAKLLTYLSIGVS